MAVANFEPLPPPPPPPMSNRIPDCELENVEDNGKLRMKVIVPNVGVVLYPEDGQRVDLTYSSYKEDYSCIENKVATSFILGGDQCIPAFDLAVRKMRVGEVAVVKASAEYAFGIFGHRPKLANVPKKPEKALPRYAPNENIIFEISLLNHYEFDHRLLMAHKRRIGYTEGLLERGNQLFVLKEYQRAIESYAYGLVYLADYDMKTSTYDELKVSEELQERLYLPMMSCYDKIGNMRRCQKAAEKVLEVNCMNWKALYMKGRCMAVQGEKKGGLEFMKKALGLKPTEREIKAAIDQVIAEIQKQTTPGKSRKKGKKRGRKGRQNAGVVPGHIAKTKVKETDTEEKHMKKIMDQASIAAGTPKHGIDKYSENHAQESNVEAMLLKREVAEMEDIKQSVENVMNEIIDQVVLVTEGRKTEARMPKQTVENLMEVMVTQVVSTIEREEKETELVVVKETIGRIVEEIVEHVVTTAESKKEEAEKVIIEENVGGFLDETIDQAISTAGKKENEAETDIFNQSIDDIGGKRLDEVVDTIGELKEEPVNVTEAAENSNEAILIFSEKEEALSLPNSVSCWSCFKCKGLRKKVQRFFRRFHRKKHFNHSISIQL